MEGELRHFLLGVGRQRLLKTGIRDGKSQIELVRFQAQIGANFQAETKDTIPQSDSISFFCILFKLSFGGYWGWFFGQKNPIKLPPWSLPVPFCNWDLEEDPILCRKDPYQINKNHDSKITYLGIRPDTTFYTLFWCPFTIAKKLFALPNQRALFVQQVRCGSLGWGVSALSLVNVWSYYTVVRFIFPHYIQLYVLCCSLNIISSLLLSSLSMFPPSVKAFHHQILTGHLLFLVVRLFNKSDMSQHTPVLRRFREWFLVCFK